MNIFTQINISTTNMTDNPKPPSTNIKLHVLSDIHLEFHKTLPKFDKKIQIDPSATNILCLCGDIGYPRSNIYKAFIAWCSTHFDKVFLIAGNHEYYGTEYTMEETANYIAYICEKYPNVTFLNRSTELYKGHLFIGTTLWSNIAGQDLSTVYYNDFNIISPRNYQQLHSTDLDWLNWTLKTTPVDQPVIVLTHHLPTYRAIHPDYQTSPINFLFANHLDTLIKTHNNIKYWLCGHTHKHTELKINNTHIIVNPIGYPRENDIQVWNKQFDLSINSRTSKQYEEIQEEVEFI